jgi:hypothetical protein
MFTGYKPELMAAGNVVEVYQPSYVLYMMIAALTMMMTSQSTFQ